MKPVKKIEMFTILDFTISKLFKSDLPVTGVSVFKVCQCSFPEPYGSGFWFVFFGVIVPITPHTQNITCNKVVGIYEI